MDCFAPEYVPYLIEEISLDPVLYGRKDPDFYITVSDTRIYSDTWYLYCTLLEPMTGEKIGRPIPGDLVFTDSTGELYKAKIRWILSDVPLP